MMSVSNDPSITSAPVRHGSHHHPSGSPINAQATSGGATGVGQTGAPISAPTAAQASTSTQAATQTASGASSSVLNLLA